METNTSAQRARSVLRIGSVALALFVAMHAANAEEVDDAKRRASALLDEGNQLFASKSYEAAKKKYEAAYAAYASPKILLNLAEVSRELGHADHAVEYYEKFVAEAGPNVESKHKELAQRRISELEAQLGRISVEGPAGLEITIDGKIAGKIPFAVRAVGGRHRVEARGFREDVMVRVGSVEVVRVPEEKPVAVVVPPVPPPAVPPPLVAAPPISAPPPAPVVAAQPVVEESSVLASWWLWAGVGVVAAGAVAVGVAASSGGDDFVPSGELGRLSTADWEAFTP